MRPGVGTIYDVQPEPIDPRCSIRFSASSVTLILESRIVDEESLAASYADDPAGLAEIQRSMPEEGFSDRGMSIHVVGAEDEHEYLRFDVFDDDPHYHYIRPNKTHNHWVPFDAVSGGDMFDFVMRCLSTRLPEMLCEAGGESAALDLEPDDLHAAVKSLQKAALLARDAGR
jgi:hypothetical protein